MKSSNQRRTTDKIKTLPTILSKLNNITNNLTNIKNIDNDFTDNICKPDEFANIDSSIINDDQEYS